MAIANTIGYKGETCAAYDDSQGLLRGFKETPFTDCAVGMATVRCQVMIERTSGISRIPLRRMIVW
jgi:hypothetical protein